MRRSVIPYPFCLFKFSSIQNVLTFIMLLRFISFLFAFYENEAVTSRTVFKKNWNDRSINVVSPIMLVLIHARRRQNTT